MLLARGREAEQRRRHLTTVRRANGPPVLAADGDPPHLTLIALANRVTNYRQQDERPRIGESSDDQPGDALE
jgi:hypothetical protein